MGGCSWQRIFIGSTPPPSCFSAPYADQTVPDRSGTEQLGSVCSNLGPGRHFTVSESFRWRGSCIAYAKLYNLATGVTDNTFPRPISHAHLHSLIPSYSSTMRLFGGDVAPSHYSTLQNNAASWWWQDAGMRKLAVAIGVGFAGTINGGKPYLGLRYTPSCTPTDVFRIRRVTHEWSLIEPALRDCH